MTTRAGVGMGRHHNPNLAGREAAEQALQKAGIVKPDFVFMFASIGYDQHSVLRAVREATGGAPLTGCSVEGTIDGDEADESNFSVLVTAISSDELRWHNGIARGFEDDSRAVGKRKDQLGGEKPKLVFQFECATRGKMMFRDQEKLQILKRFRQSLDPDAPWVGFYAVGEIGPVEKHNDLHLFTSVVLALS